MEAGCDESGRGCLAGPVFAAAVILPPGFSHPWLRDSKDMTAGTRDKLRKIIERKAIAWSVASVSNTEIDETNILLASITAMHRALNKLTVQPEFIIVDGNRFYQYRNIPHQCIVKGDSKYTSIAAASVLAKTHRDEFILSIANQFPQYDWKNNKGYPTQIHRDAIRMYGVTPFHRLSFRLEDRQTSLIFDD
jgi:ribonuclease HII